MSGYTPLAEVGELPCACPDCADACMAEPGVIGRCRECRDAARRTGECHPVDPGLGRGGEL